jgi:hypothetical protein
MNKITPLQNTPEKLVEVIVIIRLLSSGLWRVSEKAIKLLYLK